jgi:hypothetical protein
MILQRIAKVITIRNCTLKTAQYTVQRDNNYDVILSGNEVAIQSYKKLRDSLIDQARKSIWWMPWHQEPKKDVISCDKLR